MFRLNSNIEIPVLTYYEVTTDCTACGLCVPMCKAEAIRVAEPHYYIVESLCDACGDCTACCPTTAILPHDENENSAKPTFLDELASILGTPEA